MRCSAGCLAGPILLTSALFPSATEPDMFIRQRGINLSLERPVYVPAVKGPDGKTDQVPARRTTKYLGSIKSWWTPDRVPNELREKLTPAELTELDAYLQRNVTPPTDWMAKLPEFMKLAGNDMLTKAQAMRAEGKDPRKSVLADQLKAISQAGWELLKAAQAAGVRRAPKRVVVVVKKPAKAVAPVVRRGAAKKGSSKAAVVAAKGSARRR